MLERVIELLLCLIVIAVFVPVIRELMPDLDVIHALLELLISVF